MASGWDAASSDSEDENRLDFTGSERELWKHLPRLVDGVTKHGITEATQLVALYQYQLVGSEVDNRLLKNLTGVSAPAVPCQLVLEDDERFPPTIDPVEHGYHLRLSFNKLVSRDNHSSCHETDNAMCSCSLRLFGSRATSCESSMSAR